MIGNSQSSFFINVYVDVSDIALFPYMSVTTHLRLIPLNDSGKLTAYENNILKSKLH